MIKVWTDDNPTKVTIPTPSNFTWSYQDLDKDSGRNDNGLMMRNVLAHKRKIQISWNASKNVSDHQSMISLLTSLPPFFYCEFPSPKGGTEQMECYRGDIKTNLYRYDISTGNIWKDTSVNFIER